MIRNYKVVAKEGIHARPASALVSMVTKYPKDEVNIIYKDKKFTLKSMIAVLSLAIPFDAEFQIETIGPNEIEIFSVIEKTLKKHSLI